MKVVEVDCFEVTESYDRDSTHIAYVSNMGLAHAIVALQKNYRSFHEFKKTFVISESMADIDNYSKENLRKSGLAKLTTQERQALGL